MAAERFEIQFVTTAETAGGDQIAEATKKATAASAEATKQFTAEEDAINDLRLAAEHAAREKARMMTVTGTGLASDPADFFREAEKAASSGKVKESFEEVGKSAKQVSQVLQDSTDPAMAHFNATAEETVSSTGKVAGNGRMMLRLFTQLDQLVPGLGTAMRGLNASMDGKTFEAMAAPAAITGAILSIEFLVSRYKEYKKELLTMPTPFEGQASAIEAVRVAYEHAEVAAALYVHKLAQEINAEETAAAFSKERVGALKEQASEQEKLNNAQKNLGHAIIDAQEKQKVDAFKKTLQQSGLDAKTANDAIAQFTTQAHKKALEEKFALDVEYGRKKLALEENLRNQELQIKKDQLRDEKAELEKAVDATSGHDGKGGELGHAYATAHAAAERNRAAIGTDQENLRGAKATISKGQEDGIDHLREQVDLLFQKFFPKEDQNAKLIEKLSRLRDEYNHGSMHMTTDLPEIMRKMVQIQKYGDAEDEQKVLTRSIAKGKGKQAALDEAEGVAKENLDAKKAEVHELIKSTRALERQVEADERRNKAVTENARAVEADNEKAEYIKAGGDPTKFKPFAPPPVARSVPPTNPAGHTDREATPVRENFPAGDVVSAVEAYSHTHRMSQEQGKTISGLVQFLKTHGQSQKQINDLIAALADGHRTAAEKIGQLQMLVAQINSRLGQGRTP